MLVPDLLHVVKVLEREVHPLLVAILAQQVHPLGGGQDERAAHRVRRDDDRLHGHSGVVESPPCESKCNKDG